MLATSTDLRATYTRRLGELLAGEDGTRILALLQKLRLAVDHDPDRFRLPQPTVDQVGNWRRNGESFRRNPALREEWHLWADVEEIGVKTTSPRIVLLGESVARGYFYDPATNCASVLGDRVTALPGLAGAEVVDLARTNATATDLLRTALELAPLRPDALVVFAGNNWDPDLSPHQLQRVADAVAAEGFRGSQRVFTELLVAHGGSVLDALAALRDVLGVPLILVLPEFNLADWRDEVAELCPALPGDATHRWITLRQAAEQALTDGDLARAVQLGTALVKLDSGTSPVGHHVIAEAERRRERYDSARRSLQRARDAVVGVVPHSPRCPTAVQELLRRKAAEHGFSLVDLPAVFARHRPLPDRTLFLDYCHLTRTGIELAMGEAAARLAAVLGAPLSPPDPPVSGDSGAENGAGSTRNGTDAVAHFLAAVHNAHYGQADDVLLHHLEQAVATDPAITVQLEAYLDYQTRRAPHWMCASFLRACAEPAVARYLHAADSRLTGKLADNRLRQAMVTVLARYGHDVEQDWQGLLIAEHAAPVVDLLHDAYRAETFRQRSGYSSGPAKGFIECYGHRCDFTLVLDRAVPVRLELTCRLFPHAAEDSGWLVLAVNGLPVKEVQVRRGWQTTRIPLPSSALRPGPNRVELRWPPLAVNGAAQLAEAVAALERGELPTSLPSTGQIHSFTATCEES